MGNLKDLASMIPGVGKAIKDVDIDDNAFKGIESIIRSMTAAERANPDIINASRRQRIAKGSGNSLRMSTVCSSSLRRHASSCAGQCYKSRTR